MPANRNASNKDASSVALVLLMWRWRSMPTEIWNIESPTGGKPAAVGRSIRLTGWVTAAERGKCLIVAATSRWFTRPGQIQCARP
jgi:hypothetical protein